MAEKWTKTSSPVERSMNPYPFAPLNHLTTPRSLTIFLSFFNSRRCNYATVPTGADGLSETIGFPLDSSLRGREDATSRTNGPSLKLDLSSTCFRSILIQPGQSNRSTCRSIACVTQPGGQGRCANLALLWQELKRNATKIVRMTAILWFCERRRAADSSEFRDCRGIAGKPCAAV